MHRIPYLEQLRQRAGKKLHVRGCRMQSRCRQESITSPLNRGRAGREGGRTVAGSFMGPESISGNPIKVGGYKWAPRIGFDIQLSFPFQLS